MRVQLISPPKTNALYTVLSNRGVEDIKHYTSLSENDILPYSGLGLQNLQRGFNAINNAATNFKKTLVVVDCDVDGYTSSALLINYLSNLYPEWVHNNLTWFIHDGKQHGLSDCIQYIQDQNFEFVIAPDSSSNNYDEHAILAQKNVPVLVLDHHEAETISKDAIIINNQLSDYKNKQLSGVGVVWQFCRYIDNAIGKNFSNLYLDLVALGLTADMMSMLSYETAYLINTGFRKENIKNPFITEMIKKNNFSLSKAEYKSYHGNACTPMGAAFFIAPFLNAVSRSGVKEEKQLIFTSMIDFLAYVSIPSTKRGHALGESEYLVTQAVRTVTNIKNRQTKAEEAGIEKLQHLIQQNNMMEHKMLLFLLQPQDIKPQIRGLIANKFISRYQRPCAILTKSQNNTYDGSMRGYTKTGISDFKKICQACPGVIYVQGHANAAGLSIAADKTEEFLNSVDEMLKDVPSDPMYRVDYSFRNKPDNDVIETIAMMNDYWGQDMQRAYISLTFKVSSKNFTVMKSNTLKFTVGQCSIIKFSGTEQQISKFNTEGFVQIEAVCQCVLNEWMGRVSPQLLMKDYTIIDSHKFYF